MRETAVKRFQFFLEILMLYEVCMNYEVPALCRFLANQIHFVDFLVENCWTWIKSIAHPQKGTF